MFMDPKAISTNCIVSSDGDNYKAILYLELVSETGNSMSYTLEKIYKAKDVVKNRSVPLGFSVWPDIKTNDWNQYYYFYDGNSQVNILPKNIFSVADIRDKLESLTISDKIKFLDNMMKSHQVVGEEIQGFLPGKVQAAGPYRHGGNEQCLPGRAHADATATGDQGVTQVASGGPLVP